MNIDVIRAWKDSSYRANLSEAELVQLPESPVGRIELTDDELKAVCGALAQTGGGGISSIGLGCNQSTSQSGVCQSVGGGSTCNSSNGVCQSQGGNCPSVAGGCQSTQGRCPSQGGASCNRTGFGVIC